MKVLKIDFNHFSKLYPDITFLEYKKINNQYFIICSDKYGICKITVGNLHRNKKLTIRAAINKTEYFINQAREIHGNKYDYSLVDWISAKIDVKIICNKHGIFEQMPDKHLISQNCYKCERIKNGLKQARTKEEFLEKANLLYGGLYTYTDYLSYKSDEIIQINCVKHGLFSKKIGKFLQNQGCRKCSDEDISYRGSLNYSANHQFWVNKGLQSKNFDSFKCYIIKCWDKNETFYKIGKTYVTIKSRFRLKSSMPYSYEVIKIIENEGLFISKLEETLKKENREFSYVPQIKFHGMYECFTKNILLNY